MATALTRDELQTLATEMAALRTACTDQLDTASVDAARALLQDDAFAIAQFCGIDEDDTVPGEGGLARVREVADRRWETVQATRRRIAELLQELGSQ